MFRYSAVRFLEEAAQSSPLKRAVIDSNGSCTFAELRTLARSAASNMLSLGLSPDQGVVVWAEKGIGALAVMLGSLYAGGFYVPVDPDAPAGRVRAICSTLGSPLVVAGASNCASAAEATGRFQTVALSDLLAVSSDPDELPGEQTIDSDPAYIMFTSGSTGRPKGVVVSHRAVIGFTESFVSSFLLCEDDVIANQAPFDFDVSVKDIYGALASRATLILIPRAMFLEPVKLVALLNASRVTVMTWAVAALCTVTSFHALDGQMLPSVRAVMFSGEVMPLAHLKEWMAHLPMATFVNLYGPTEVTCNCLFHILDRSRDYSDGIPLGDPLPNRDVELLDVRGNAVRQVGQVGEIVVRGSFLASGYIGASAEESAAFAALPWRGFCAERAYRTGDLARFNAAGELIYCGRSDNQIKHMGHRIELEGIEAAFESWPIVRRCRCVYDADRRRIVAFFEGGASEHELKRFSQECLPVAMRPAQIICVSTMPVTKNGKVDRVALLREAVAKHEK